MFHINIHRILLIVWMGMEWDVSNRRIIKRLKTRKWISWWMLWQWVSWAKCLRSYSRLLKWILAVVYLSLCCFRNVIFYVLSIFLACPILNGVRCDVFGVSIYLFVLSKFLTLSTAGSLLNGRDCNYVCIGLRDKIKTNYFPRSDITKNTSSNDILRALHY